MKIDELIDGVIYFCEPDEINKMVKRKVHKEEDGILFLRNCGYNRPFINFYDKTLYNKSTDECCTGDGLEFREATEEEIHYFNLCLDNNKFITKPIFKTVYNLNKQYSPIPELNNLIIESIKLAKL